MDELKLHDIEIHKKCADSLMRVLNHVWDDCGRSQAKINQLHYDLYSGSFNYRAKRGSNSLSCHAYAVALDFDSENNAFHSQRHFFQEGSLLVMRFKEEGWSWGGNWSPSSVDAMHFQSARVH